MSNDVDVADEEPTDEGAKQVAKNYRPRKAFGKARREYSEEELDNPLLITTLLDDVDRLEFEKDKLQGFEALFHKADKLSAVRSMQIAQLKKFDALFSIMLTIGAAIFGFAPNLEAPKYAPWVAGFLGVALMGGAIIAKTMIGGQSHED